MNEFKEVAFFISKGILFHITAPERDMLLLNKVLFGFGITKFSLETDRKFEPVSFSFLIRKKSVRYSGAILFTILYITLAYCKKTFSSKDYIFK